MVTDRQTDTHTYKPSTVMLAGHACRGLITATLTSVNFLELFQKKSTGGSIGSKIYVVFRHQVSNCRRLALSLHGRYMGVLIATRMTWEWLHLLLHPQLRLALSKTNFTPPGTGREPRRNNHLQVHLSPPSLVHPKFSKSSNYIPEIPS